ncbi:MAG TPA: magnesium transporter [Candidatus Limnocylindrales bacterium]|nr:magnesium transporter [Candidatus Limnocylindrales bacterium]
MSAPATETETPDHAELRALLEAGDEAAARAAIADLHPADLADVLDALDQPERQLQLFRLLEPETASEVVREISEHSKASLVELLSDARLSAVLERLDTDDAADLLGHLDEDRKDRLLRRTSPEARRNVAGLLTYAEDTAGGIMKTEVATATTLSTVREVIESIRRHADDYHDIQEIYVTDEQRRLKGVVPLRELLLFDDETPLERFMQTETVPVDVDMDQEEVARVFGKYDLLSVPVLDSLGRVVGRITVDDIVDVIAEEATEDILKLAGVGDESFVGASPFDAVRSRLPWLVFNFATAGLSALIIAQFEETIRQVAVAAALMTVISAMAGNAGTQTMTVLVRAIALGEARGPQARRLLAREALTSLINGALLGLSGALIVYLWRGDARVAAVMGFALLINLQVSAAVGTMVPLVLRSFSLDPAVASSVLVTAATDWAGFFVFLALLSVML